MKRFISLSKPKFTLQEIREVVSTLKSGWLTTGEKTHIFEEQFRTYVGTKYSVALNSCTAALFLALDAIGITAGDEVITTPLTFAATANVIVHHGAIPVFVDVECDTGNIDVYKIERAITRKTKAIMPVHLYGRSCNMTVIMNIAKMHNLKVIEDAAHAPGGQFHGKMLGSFGDIGCFSFYATKNLTTGEGGMLVTNSKTYADEVRSKSLHGLNKNAWNRYSAKGPARVTIQHAGYKYNMMDLQASLGIHQLAMLESNLIKRQIIWKMYDQAFKNNPALTIPVRDVPKTRHARHLYTILLNINYLSISRDEFIELMRKKGIGTGIHFPVIHLSDFYKKRFHYSTGLYHFAEDISERTVSLPLTPYLAEADVRRVIKTVLDIVKQYRK